MRLEVTRRSELAVRAMIVLGGNQGRMKGAVLAQALGTTPAFVAQVVGPLVKAGWVRSDPGPAGGYAVHAALAEVSVLQVIEAVDGVVDSGVCVVEARACDRSAPCVLHFAWSRARAELVRALGETPLSTLAEATAADGGVVSR
ncbi:MAG: Rrf2 family transcriptional regulator [Actinobacteria bacterium]|nr:Rrf2 family transcriptional regulator [Actinomycetota bacterium]